jgi:flagellar hook-length control protein FliK
MACGLQSRSRINDRLPGGSVSTVVLPVTAGTVRAASLHPDHRPNEHGETPFASLLDTGTGPRILEKPAPRSERPRPSDKPAHNNTADQKPAPSAAKNETPDASPAPAEAKADPEPEAKEQEIKLIEAVLDVAIDSEATEVAETSNDKTDAATIVDALLVLVDEPAVTAPAAPVVAAPVAPAQPVPELVAAPAADGEASIAVSSVAVAEAPTVATPAEAAEATAEPQPATPAGKIVPQAEKSVDTVKPEPLVKAAKHETAAVKDDTVEDAKPELHKTHQAHVQSHNEAPAERKAAAKPTIETPAEASVSAAFAATAASVARSEAASNLAASAEAAVQPTAPLPSAPVIAPAAVTPAQALAAAAPVPVSGLAVEIVTQAREGKNRFEIRLDPPELGRVDVRLDIDGQGNVTSRLLVERQDTLDLLRRESSALERALNDAGLKTSNDGLQFSLRDQGSDNARRDDGGRFARVVVPTDAAASEPASYRLPRLGGLDIRV